MKPKTTEPICPVSYEITTILVGGAPEGRPGFWKAYRQELELNLKTNYENYHMKLCRPYLKSLRCSSGQPAAIYFREGRLTTEKKTPKLRGADAYPVIMMNS